MTTKLAPLDAYCVKCKEKRQMATYIIKTSDSGRQMAMGTCDVCGTKCNRILGKVGVTYQMLDATQAPSPVPTYKVTLEHARSRFGWHWKITYQGRFVGRGFSCTTFGRKMAIKRAIRRYERNRNYAEQVYSYEIPVY